MKFSSFTFIWTLALVQGGVEEGGDPIFVQRFRIL